MLDRDTSRVHGIQPGSSCRSYPGRFFGTSVRSQVAPSVMSNAVRQDMWCCALCIQDVNCEMWMMGAAREGSAAAKGVGKRVPTCTLLKDSSAPFDATQTTYRGNWRNHKPPMGCSAETPASNLGADCFVGEEHIRGEALPQVSLNTKLRIIYNI